MQFRKYLPDTKPSLSQFKKNQNLKKWSVSVLQSYN